MYLKNILFPSCLYLAFLFVLLTIPAANSQVPGGPEQYVSFYSQRNCSTNSLLGTVRATTNILNPTLQNASAVAVNGFWRIDYLPNINPSFTNSGGVCTPSPTNITTGTYLGVQRYGNDNQNGSELFLHITQNFGGIPTQVNINGSNLPGIATFNSWYFTGNNEWTLFTGRNYTGNTTCLKPDTRTVTLGYGVRYSLNDRQTVGSVRYGCTGSGTSVASSIFQSMSTIFIAACFLSPVYVAILK